MIDTCEHIKLLEEFLKNYNLKIFFEVYCEKCKVFYYFKEEE